LGNSHVGLSKKPLSQPKGKKTIPQIVNRSETEEFEVGKRKGCARFRGQKPRDPNHRLSSYEVRNQGVWGSASGSISKEPRFTEISHVREKRGEDKRALFRRVAKRKRCEKDLEYN